MSYVCTRMWYLVWARDSIDSRLAGCFLFYSCINRSYLASALLSLHLTSAELTRKGVILTMTIIRLVTSVTSTLQRRGWLHKEIAIIMWCKKRSDDESVSGSKVRKGERLYCTYVRHVLYKATHLPRLLPPFHPGHTTCIFSYSNQ